MPQNIGYGVPETYDYINMFNSGFSPSTIHVKNTQLQRFFRRYLLQKAMSVFKWELPETWCRDYFLYVLYSWGCIGVVETDKFGVICQAGAPYGYDIYYQPTNLIITNPLLKGRLEPRIGIDCTVFKLQPDWGGIMDLVNYYADMMALCAETAGVNLLNSHLSFVFPAKDKVSAETYKKLFDKVSGGEPAVVIGKGLFKEDGSPAWDAFQQNIKQNYIVSDILADMRKIEFQFDTDIGIPNANVDKRERLLVDEINANNIETTSKCELWLEQLKKCAEQTNTMFGTSISVDWRHSPDELIGKDTAEGVDIDGQSSNNVRDGAV